ncbi:MAG TPA: hypothetical protein VFT87_05540 [Candidatus Saccharimonadales bacterium]|nr:hypothetical protein [Candidatus Saccharimonadales bacterium]
MLSSLLLAVCAFALGWFLRDMRDKVKEAYAFVRSLRDLKVDNELSVTPRSSIVEPKVETPGERAKREQEELLERLNAPGNQTR